MAAVAALAYLALFTGVPDSAGLALLGGAAVLPLPWAALTARRGAHRSAQARKANAPTAFTLVWWSATVMLCASCLLTR